MEPNTQAVWAPALHPVITAPDSNAYSLRGERGGRCGEQTGSSHPPEPARGCGSLSRPGAASPAEVGGPGPSSWLARPTSSVIRHPVWSVRSLSARPLGLQDPRGGGRGAGTERAPPPGSSWSGTSILRGQSACPVTAQREADLFAFLLSLGALRTSG